MSIIFCSQDIERVLGLEGILPNISIICINRNDLSDYIEKKVKNFFCLEDYEPVKDAISTYDLLAHPKVEKFIQKVSKNPQILVFKNIPKLEKLAQKKGWKLLNNPAKFNQIFEDKINFIQECQKNDIQVPLSVDARLSETSYIKLSKILGRSFVVQFRRGHAGETTHFINDKNDWSNLLKSRGDFPARISSFIIGETFTYNLCINENGFEYSNLMYQITGKKPFTVHDGGTCGVDMVYAHKFQKHEKAMRQVVDKFAALMKKEGYKGFLGVDFLLEKKTGKVFLIECNPRLTANVSLNSQIEIMQGREPLIKCHLNTFDATKTNFAKTLKLTKSQKSQQKLGAFFVLRNNGHLPVQLKSKPHSGKYAILKNGKMKLVGCTFDLASCGKNEFILHVEGSKSVISPNVKIATITAPFSVLDSNGSVKKFVKEVFEMFEFKTIYVHPVDFWKNKKGMPKKKVIDIYQKPLRNIDQLSEFARNRNRQTQCLQKEGIFDILGEYDNFFLVKKWDQVFGWAHKNDVEEKEFDASQNGSTLILQPQSGQLGKVDSPSDAEVLNWFKKFSKTPYLWGGLTNKGIDCSGLVQRHFVELFNYGLPKHTKDQIKYGRKLRDVNAVQNHDLVFLISKKKKISHVGIFFNGELWHACLSKNAVVHEKITEVLKKYDLLEARRVI